jgi:hypothetical protein
MVRACGGNCGQATNPASRATGCLRRPSLSRRVRVRCEARLSTRMARDAQRRLCRVLSVLPASACSGMKAGREAGRARTARSLDKRMISERRRARAMPECRRRAWASVGWDRFAARRCRASVSPPCRRDESTLSRDGSVFVPHLGERESRLVGVVRETELGTVSMY